MVPAKYAEPFSPHQCLHAAQDNLDIAKITTPGRHDGIYEEAMERAGWWKMLAAAGGSEAYRYQTCFPKD